ncbi:MAG: isopentenyl-diphosphate Delta-isomerase [Sediminibacterium sp.]|jgi:isopentenyl-diphosphate delta-isomerase|uniref:isopentenyl-diphosphate Delta-isomerase n=1 Tax=Sediminibacterium sp. TaxID=1917865 RepID=UPI001B74E1EB|nr:isopentenyl-diphosphate Delta-isomerase [Sediminibacterium sp.]MBP7346323.1 isopentenyl-diphosphate Delta-isomerase [Sediminibacterium sp.]MDO8997741.1 isopentenyl-diphosphate Delta-isomerase [Sediminibacterium sp.]HPH37676.1 isopentenyl-diphosphate Delta-isomerase [Sediminibacterium sp.]
MLEQVILVNEADQEIGFMEKMEAHEKAVLHRAFSVFILNDAGEMLLQQRASNKYHSANLWTNTCCSHPKPGELTKSAAHRRLQEEMGFDTPLEKAFDFIYKAPFDNGLTEYEFDHVFIGNYQGNIQPNPLEVKDYAFRTFENINQQIATKPTEFTSWFLIAFPKVYAWWMQQNK